MVCMVFSVQSFQGNWYVLCLLGWNISTIHILGDIIQRVSHSRTPWWVQLGFAVNVIVLCWEVARKKNNQLEVFSSNGGVFSVCGFCHLALQSFKCVCAECGHILCACIHKAHFPSSLHSAQLFCLHCTLVRLFCCETHLSSPDPILAWLV